MTDSHNQNSINIPAPNTTTNGEGIAMVEGNIVAQSAVTDDTAVLTRVLGQTNIIGVVSVGANDGALITLAPAACAFSVLITGAVDRSDFIEASATNGVGIVGAGVGVFAIAIESNADVGTKLVRCRATRSELF